MIVAEKELKIEGGYAPDLNMKMGEVNRQYILIPPFDISSYSVRSEIVKPDNTFVYTDQAINTDGNILLTLPEQAGAVAGYGHYIIKIYDLNTIVYSAVGNLRIDDHLILDGMIESVAEVNGYEFPDDFVIRGELGNIFNDSTVSSETGWTSQKISQEIGSAAVVFDNTQISNTLGWTSSKINTELLGMIDNNITSNTKGWSSSKIESEIAGVLDDTTTSLTTGWSSSKIDSEIGAVLDDNTTSSTTGWSSDKITSEINAHTPTVSKTATGNPLELTDAANAPMVRCVTEIQGYQEGSGTPSSENIRPIHAYIQTTISVVGVEKYGFHIDGNKSVPTEMISYLSDCDNASYTPAYMDYTNDVFDYGSWENAWFIQGIRPCILGTDGAVIKYLDKDDYTKDVDGYTVDIGGTLANANVMVEFPKIWLKVVPDSGDSTSANVYISNIKLDDGYKDYAYIDYQKAHKNHFYLSAYNSSTIDSKLRSLSGQTTTKTKSLAGTTEISYAEANGAGWSTEHAGQIMLVNFLLLLIGKSTNTQAVFGQGLHTSGSEAVNNGFETGVHNAKGLFYGTNSGAAATYTNAVKVFGIENWWGFQWQRYRGDILSSNTLKIKLCYGQEDGSTVDNFNTDGTGYRTVSGGSATGTSGNYISQMVFDTGGMYAKEANNSNASSTSKYCDGYWFSFSGVQFAFRGGDSNAGALVGALCVARSVDVGGVGWNLGARLSYI